MSLWSRLRGFVGRVLATVRDAVSTAVRAAQGAARAVRAAVVHAAGRHQDRAGDDRAYARAISTAAAELAATVITRPWLATALAVAIAGILTPDDHEHHRQMLDEDEYMPPRHTSRPFTPPRPSPQPPVPLWDRFD